MKHLCVPERLEVKNAFKDICSRNVVAFVFSKLENTSSVNPLYRIFIEKLFN